MLRVPRLPVRRLFSTSSAPQRPLPSLPALPSPTLLRGKTVVVTGGARGIGLAVAHQMLSMGASVAILAKTAESCAAAADTLAKAHPSAVLLPGLEAKPWDPALAVESPPAQALLAIPCDVSDDSSLSSAFKLLSTALPAPPSQLYACAGICPQGLLARTSAATVAEVLGVNVGGTMLASKLLLKHAPRGVQQQQREGSNVAVADQWSHAADSYLRVVAFGSVVGSVGETGLSVYGASKAALVGFVKSLARETPTFKGNTLTANVIAPGFIDTDMTRSTLSEQQRQSVTARTCVGRTGSAGEVAALCAWLASPASGFVTGQVIAVDGGAT